MNEPNHTAAPAANASPDADTKLPPAPAEESDKTVQPEETEPIGGKPEEEENKTLLGGAQQLGSAEKNPDGGEQPGDGKQTDGNVPPQDPYETLTFPEGAAVDEKDLAGFKILAKEVGLTADAAQKLVNFEAQRNAAQAKLATEAWSTETTVKYGDKLPGVLAQAARAIDKFGGDELRVLLDQTGLGNHPLLVEAFSKAGALIKEDVSVPSNGAAQGDKTFTQALYGASKK